MPPIPRLGGTWQTYSIANRHPQVIRRMLAQFGAANATDPDRSGKQKRCNGRPAGYTDPRNGRLRCQMGNLSAGMAAYPLVEIFCYFWLFSALKASLL